MRRSLILFALAGSLQLASAEARPSVPSTPSGSPLEGTWQLDLARTHYGPGVDHRREETFTCETRSGHLQCEIRSVRADGRHLTGRFSAVIGGDAAPVAGLPEVDQVRLTRVAADVLDATFNMKGRPAFAYRAFGSADARSLMMISIDP